jgi:hypothetical protein
MPTTGHKVVQRLSAAAKKKIKSLSAAKHSFDLRRRSIFGRRISSINCVQFSATAWAEQAATGAYPISPRPRLQDFRPRRVRMALKRAQDVFAAQRNWPGLGVLSRPSEKIIKNLPFIYEIYVGLQSYRLK